VIIISQEYAWIPHPRTRECGAQTSILVHTIPWNVSNIFGPTGHPAPPLSPAVAEYCGVARGQQASAGNRISAASSRKRKHSVVLVSAEGTAHKPGGTSQPFASCDSIFGHRYPQCICNKRQTLTVPHLSDTSGVECAALWLPRLALASSRRKLGSFVAAIKPHRRHRPKTQTALH